jgi:glycosyltransferase involved in cell wall biosynthesis
VRVVFLTHNYPRWPEDVAGGFLATLARALAARGVEVRVVAPSDEGRGGDEHTDGVFVRRVRYAPAARETIAYHGAMLQALRRPAGWEALAGLWRALRRAAQEELELGAHLVHAHWWVPGGLAAPIAAPLVLTVHGTDAALLKRSRIARGLARPVFRRARVVTTVSRELATAVQEGVGRFVSPAHIQPMPVDPGAFRLSSGGAGAVTVSRLVPQKRVHLAIEAVACLAALEQQVPLTIVGDGPERPKLQALAASLGVSRLVSFVGAVPHSAIPQYLERADLMLFPAQGEGFGLVAAEALMAGVPVVACWDGGGILDVVPEGGAGRLVLPSGEALADAALGLLQDDGRQRIARIAGERWRETLSPDFVAARCEEWYREALA